MTYRGLLTRAQIGLVPPQRRSTEIAPTGTTLHYAGAAQGVAIALTGHPRCLALWRGFQAFHMRPVADGGRGWADIAYTLGACQHGWLLAGRGAGVRTAATGPANGYRYAVCSVIGGSETPTRDLLDAVNAGVTMLRNSDVKPAGLAVDSHRDHMQTSCAGEAVTAHARTIDGRTVWVVDPDPEEDDMGHVDTISDAAAAAIARRVVFTGWEDLKLRDEQGREAPRPDGTVAKSGFTMIRLADAAATHARVVRFLLETGEVLATLRAALDELRAEVAADPGVVVQIDADDLARALVRVVNVDTENPVEALAALPAGGA